MNLPLRLCGDDCPTPDLPHIDPEPDWIGNVPIMHGESEHIVPLTHDQARSRPLFGGDPYCLCGHPNYLLCPEAFGDGSILGMTIAPPEDEAGI
mgnify:CR=1 FL=1